MSATVLGAHTDHVEYIVGASPSFALHAIAMENVTVRESARLRARCAEPGTAHPQPSTQSGPGPTASATATPSTAQPEPVPVATLPGTLDATPSHSKPRP